MSLLIDDQVRKCGGREVRLLLLAAAINAGLFAVALSILNLLYESNDDAIMMQIASGMMTGRPAEEIVYSNVLIGRALADLYQWTTRVNWYTAYVIGAHFATMTALLYAFLRVRGGRTAIWVFLLLFAQFEPALLLRLQFTAIAVMAGAVGLLLCTTSQFEVKNPSRVPLVLGATLVSLGGAIRFDALLYATLVVAPVLVWTAWSHRDWRIARRIGICFGLALALFGFNNWHYRNDAPPRWQAYVEYNAARGKLHDLPIVEYDENTQFFFDRVGWNHTDWKMFGDWFFADPETFSFQSLQGLLSCFEGGSWSRSVPMRYLHESLEPIAAFPMMMMANILLAVLLGRGQSRVLVAGLSECVLMWGLLFGFSCYAKLVPRLVLPGFFAVSAASLLVALQADAERRHLMRVRILSPAIRAMILACALSFSACYGWASYQTAANHVQVNDRNCRDHEVFRKFVRVALKRYVERDSDSVILNWWPKYPIQWSSPFDNLRDFSRIPMIDLNWTIGSPHFRALLRHHRINDPYQAAYTDDRVWICTAPELMDDFARFVHEHYGVMIRQKQKDVFLLDSPFKPVNYSFTFYQVGVMRTDPKLREK